MRIVCDNCATKYSISDEKVRGKVFKIRCKNCSHVIIVRGDSVETRRTAPTPPPVKAANPAAMSQNQILEGFIMAAGYALEEEAAKCAMYIPQGDLITKAEEATGRVLTYTAARVAKMIRLVSNRAWEEPTAERLRQAPPHKEGGRMTSTAFAKAERQGTTPHESQERGVGERGLPSQM